MKVPLLLLVMVGLGAVVVIFIFVLGKTRSVSVEEWAQKNDPVLAGLFARNPGLSFEDEFRGRAPFYWVTDPASGHKLLIPKSEVDGAVLRFVECDTAEIPPDLLYPNRVKTSCLELRNDQHSLRALCFSTPDSQSAVVDFYNGPLLPIHRRKVGAHPDAWRESTERRDGTGEFIYSYLLNGVGPVEAFVAYKEE